MKVKFFGFKVDTRGGGLFGGPVRVENGDSIEAAINEWLAGQPGIRIEQVQQTATGVSGVGYQYLYVTVWYEPVHSPSEASQVHSR